MTELSREELERTATHFDAVANEFIQNKSVALAVQEFINRKAWSEREAGTTKPAESVRVACYKMHEWTDGRLSYWADDLVEYLVDKFHDDEDLCGEDGIDISGVEMAELRANAIRMVRKFSEYAPPQTLRHIGTIHLSMDEATKVIESMNRTAI